MRTQFSRPTPAQLDRYLVQLQNAPFSYSEVGASTGSFPAGYRHSNDRFYLGQGIAIWEKAKQELQSWQMFPQEWTFIYPDTPPVVGQEVAVCFRQFGLWWKNACRIVYCQDTAHTYGFAYGTLPTHIGSGEEYFGLERDHNDNCWFIIKAFSKPLYWGTQLFSPYMRLQQNRFIKEAGKRMQQLVNTESTTPHHEKTK